MESDRKAIADSMKVFNNKVSNLEVDLEGDGDNVERLTNL